MVLSNWTSPWPPFEKCCIPKTKVPCLSTLQTVHDLCFCSISIGSMIQKSLINLRFTNLLLLLLRNQSWVYSLKTLCYTLIQPTLIINLQSQFIPPNSNQEITFLFSFIGLCSQNNAFLPSLSKSMQVQFIQHSK